MPELEHKVAIVTGAARGTGAAIARRFAEEGARVVLGDLLDEQGEAVAKEIGNAASYRHHDVTQAEQWDEIVAHAQDRFGGIDVLVNNAAQLHLGTIETTSADVLRRLLEVNTIGPYLGMRAVLPPMRARGGGSIVQVGSIDSLSAMNGLTSYCASKWGLRGLSRAAALELGRDGIRVNSVCPSGGNEQIYAPWFKRLVEFTAGLSGGSSHPRRGVDRTDRPRGRLLRKRSQQPLYGSRPTGRRRRTRRSFPSRLQYALSMYALASHAHYQETALRVKDGFAKLRVVPKDMDDSCLSSAEILALFRDRTADVAQGGIGPNLLWYIEILASAAAALASCAVRVGISQNGGVNPCAS